MACTYSYNGRTYSEEEMKTLIQNGSAPLEFSENFSYDPVELDLEEENLFIFSNFKNITAHKQSMVRTLKNRIAVLKSAIKKMTSSDEIKKYTLIQHEMESKVESIQDDLDSYTGKNNKNFGLKELSHNAKEDLKRVQVLVQRAKSENSLEDASEAAKIINFYKSMRISFNQSSLDRVSFDFHPFFDKEEIMDENGDYIIDDYVIKAMDDIAESFELEENKLISAQEDLITSMVNSNPKIAAIHQKLSYNSLTKPMHDLTWLDSMLTDPSHGIFSENGLLPQMMLDLTNNTFAKHVAKAKSFEQRHDALLPKVEDKLKQLGYGFKSRLAKGVSFNLFFQKGTMGAKTGRLVHKYKQSFFDKRAYVINDYNNALKEIKNDSKLTNEQKKTKIRKAILKKQNWFRKNTIVFDPRRIPELHKYISDSSHHLTDDSHVKEIIDQIGERAYKQELAKQIKQYEKYQSWKNAILDTYLVQNGITKEELMNSESDNDKAFVQNLIANDPLAAAIYFYDGSVGVNNEYITPTNNYTISVPRRNKANPIWDDSLNSYRFVETNEQLDHYDPQFDIIEKHPELIEYHTLLQEELSRIQEDLPADVKEKMMINFLPSVRKSFFEKMIDPDTSIFKQLLSVDPKNPNKNFSKLLWEIFQDLWDSVALKFSVKRSSEVNYENLDLVTGKTEDVINKSFLKTNAKEIRIKTAINKAKIKKMTNLQNAIGTNTYMSVEQLGPKAMKYIADSLNTTPLEIMKAYPKQIPVGRLVRDMSINEVVQSNSLDLPKIMKFYSNMAAEFTARNELYPQINLMKEHYKQIKKIKTSNVGSPIRKLEATESEDLVEGYRKNAINQIEDWFNRVILGNFDPKQFGVLKGTVGDGKRSFLESFFNGKILSKSEKEIKSEINELLESGNLEKEEVENLEKMRQDLGGDFAASKIIENFVDYIRFLGLGYNLSSGITNFMEGQIANILLANTGDYFNEQQFYRASNIVKGSFLKTWSLGMVQTKGAAKTRFFMDKFDVLQDSSNELQKASVKSGISNARNFSPMEINRRVEYLNQSPIMIGIMLNTPINGKGGEVSNLFDAMDENGKLKPPFNTPENIESWEKNNTSEYTNFKTKIEKAIVMAHGNYSELRGMMAKSTVVGKAFMMFKTWVGSSLYGRFAVEQTDIEIGTRQFKGRYRSHTPTSAALHGALAGFTVAGPVGALVSAGIGFGFGKAYGIKSDLNSVQEGAFILKSLMMKSISMPVELVVGRKLNMSNDHALSGANFSDRDAKNIKAILTEMSIMLSFIAMTLAAKAAFWDDDNEKKEKRAIHNMLVNQFMQLSSSAAAYSNPTAMYDTFIGSLAIVRFSQDVGKAAAALNEYIEGNDLITTGVNAGESKLYNTVSKITLPSLFRDGSMTLGFGKKMERQFVKTTYDDWFWSEEKRAKQRRKIEKAQYKKQLEQEGYSELMIKKLLKVNFPPQKDLSKYEIK